MDGTASGSDQTPDSASTDCSLDAVIDAALDRVFDRMASEGRIACQVHYWERYGPTANLDLTDEERSKAQARAWMQQYAKLPAVVRDSTPPAILDPYESAARELEPLTFYSRQASR